MNSLFELSGYKLMWILVMFDLPTNTKKEMKAAAKFRADLLTLGFTMTQYSVYSRFCVGVSQIDTISAKVQNLVPSQGHVNLLSFTDKQYSRIITFRGGILKTGESDPPDMVQIY